MEKNGDFYADRCVLNHNVPNGKEQAFESVAGIGGSSSKGTTSSADAMDDAALIEGNATELGYSGNRMPNKLDCDPRNWIIAAGQLEKKRDGLYKGGWSNRFFVLTAEVLFYYLLPRKSSGADVTALLGDERGQVLICDIKGVVIDRIEEYFVLRVETKEIKRKGLTQTGRNTLELRASHIQILEKWARLLKLCVEKVSVRKSASFSKRRRRSSDPSLSISQNHNSVFWPNDAETEELETLRSMILNDVLPTIKSGIDSCHVDLAHPKHVDVWIVSAGLLLVNILCYLSPAIDSFPLWFFVNLCLLSVIVQFEKNVYEHERSIVRYNKFVRTGRETLDGLSLLLSRAIDAPCDLTSALGTKVTHDTRITGMNQALNNDNGTSKLPIGGRSLRRARDGIETLDCSWSPCPANTFNVRSRDYERTRKKEPSKEALYDSVGVDLIKDDKKIDSILNVLAMPPARSCDDLELIKRSGLPRLIIVNMQTPMKTPVPWGDDPGINAILYYAVKPETAAAAAREDCDGRPEIRLLKRFVQEHEHNDDIRRRFKSIPLALNAMELGLPSGLSKFNGKPSILFKSATIYKRMPDVLEVLVCVRQFKIAARLGFVGFMDRSVEAKIRGAFLIQGEDEDELPECVLGCTGLHRMYFDRAVHVRDLPRN